MVRKESKPEYKDPTIAEVADLMALQLCKEVGYDAPDLIARPLRILGEAMNLQIGGSLEWQRDALLINHKGEEISTHKFLAGIMNSGDFADMRVEFTSMNMDPFARPTGKHTLLTQVIEGLSNFEEGYLKPLPNFDVVNSKVVADRVGYYGPAAVVIEKQAEIFKRFTVEIQRDPELPRPLQGSPRVTVTNNFKNHGHHFGMQIEIPDSKRGFKNVFSLLIARDANKLDIARERMQEIRTKPNRAIDQVMMDLAIECAGVALENGFYPYGAVYRGYDGKIIMARNNTASDDEQEGHAEFAVLNLVRRDQPGTLYTMMEPCQSCSMKMMAKPVSQIQYSLEQDLDWRGLDTEIVKSRIAKKPDFIVHEATMMPKALELVKKANGADGKFKGEFSYAYKHNKRWYSDWVKARKKEMAKRASENLDNRFLSLRWGTNPRPQIINPYNFAWRTKRIKP